MNNCVVLSSHGGGKSMSEIKYKGINEFIKLWLSLHGWDSVLKIGR